MPEILGLFPKKGTSFLQAILFYWGSVEVSIDYAMAIAFELHTVSNNELQTEFLNQTEFHRKLDFLKRRNFVTPDEFKAIRAFSEERNKLVHKPVYDLFIHGQLKDKKFKKQILEKALKAYQASHNIEDRITA